MVDHEGEAAIDAGQEHELDLSLGLRPAPSRCNLQFPNPKNSEAAAPEDSSDLSLNMPIWGIGGTRPTQQSARIGFLGVQTKTEAQALRRQEAKKKKDEKRKLKANALNRNANEMMFWSEKRKALVRERETEEDFAERLRKRGNCGGNEGEEASATTTTSFFVRQAEGFDGNQLNVLPYLIMPGLVGSDGNGFQPVVGAGGAGGIGPYQLVEQICGHKSLKRSVSSCSRGSSPGVSDYQTTSGQEVEGIWDLNLEEEGDDLGSIILFSGGGSSSDGGSHSSHSHPLDLTKKNYLRMSNSTQMQTSHPQPSAPQPNGFAPISYSINGKAECRSSSYQTKPDQTTKKVPNLIEMATTSSKTDPCQLNQNSEVQTQTCPSKKPVLSHRIQSPCLVRNESKGVDLRRPPRPQTHQGNEAVLLPHMPCVATMGNGPNGKRITGFLYKYTKSEVSIVCVCHGNSFSPAGFVEHAGGVDIENPLRHITVAPSTFN